MIPTRKPGRGKRRRRRKPIKKREHKYIYPHKPAAIRSPQNPGLKNIANFRRCMRLTQEQLAAMSGVNVLTIRAIEQGVTLDPKLSTLRSLAQALCVSVGVLVGIENPLE